jgi:long-chain fatty acid transport protein
VVLERRVPVFNPFELGSVVDAAAVDLESDTATGFGFNLGVLGKPTESISVGASYRHSVNVDYEGTAAFTQLPTGNAQLDQVLATRLPEGALPVTTAIEFPSLFSVGVAWTRSDWTVEADFNWYGWSSFDQLLLDFENNDLDQVIEEEYEDSFQFRIGVERSFGTWALRGGYYFDESPSPPESVSPLLPDSDRNGIALGGTWTSGQFRVDAATWIIFSPDRSTEGVNRDNYNGTYGSGAFTLGVSLGYTF